MQTGRGIPFAVPGVALAAVFGALPFAARALAPRRRRRSSLSSTARPTPKTRAHSPTTSMTVSPRLAFAAQDATLRRPQPGVAP
jgi:hypothetical protein